MKQLYSFHGLHWHQRPTSSVLLKYVWWWFVSLLKHKAWWPQHHWMHNHRIRVSNYCGLAFCIWIAFLIDSLGFCVLHDLYFSPSMLGPILNFYLCTIHTACILDRNFIICQERTGVYTRFQKVTPQIHGQISRLEILSRNNCQSRKNSATNEALEVNPGAVQTGCSNMKLFG